MLGELTIGWRFIAARPGLLGLLILLVASNFATGMALVLATPMVLAFARPDVLGREINGTVIDRPRASADPACRQADDWEIDQQCFSTGVNQALADGLRALGQLINFDSRAILARLEHQLARALRPNGDGCRSRADALGLPPPGFTRSRRERRPPPCGASGRAIRGGGRAGYRWLLGDDEVHLGRVPLDARIPVIVVPALAKPDGMDSPRHEICRGGRSRMLDTAGKRALSSRP